MATVRDVFVWLSGRWKSVLRLARSMAHPSRWRSNAPDQQQQAGGHYSVVARPVLARQQAGGRHCLQLMHSCSKGNQQSCCFGGTDIVSGILLHVCVCVLLMHACMHGMP